MELINIEDTNYPDKLKQIKNPPKKLYVEGNIDILNTNCISIVGSRNCTQYGEKWCKSFVKEFIRYGITIVSGMALGIDAISHREAINCGGKTIAVLPCGLNHIYPDRNKDLYKNIIKYGGTIITEYLPDEKVNYKNFLERNRIVSGLSIATLVVEAAYRSGTSVTAKLAKSQNRDVFCIPRKFR